MSTTGDSEGSHHRWKRPRWEKLDRYISLHESHMRRFDHFIEHNGISFEVGAEVVRVHGIVRCHHGISLSVDKILTLNDQHEVSGSKYSYQATIGDPPHGIFRYDNAHQYSSPEHHDAFHRHDFDPATNEQRPGLPAWIGQENWPTLADVLAELEEWWYETGQHLNLQE